MIFTVLFAVVVGLIGQLFSVVIPALPASFESILTTIFSYVRAGAAYVWLFIPKQLAISLFEWWVSLAALLLTYELGLEVWRFITGNAGGHEATSETMKIDPSTGRVLTHTVTKRSSR